ncbi:DUF1540 domain-containing protein [Anaeromassilibacillus senegalensis]|uniref:DUF1540 domain-containing protein n=1 Tax=Anaeromassilibacillus senegalensis TaxID=1673717 RepID=UPI00068085CE|nr:DUF1540 domain-containing protein [Anaeromassilibacillus senegalensis]
MEYIFLPPVISCAYDLCLYWKNGHCSLNSISIDNIGLCESYIQIYFTEEDLAQKRIEQLEQLEKDNYF